MAQLTPQLREEILAIRNPRVKMRWQRFFAIPENLQEAMFDPPVAEKIWDIISETHGLDDVDVTKVAKIIGLIFLGELPIQNFIGALQKELKIDVQTAQMIAQDINQAIFQPVRESLMAVHGLKNNTNTRIETNDTNQNTPNNNDNRMRQPPAIKQPYTPPQPQINAEATQRQREELLNKLKNQQPQNRPYQPPRPVPPPQKSNSPTNGTSARPATWNIPNKNVVDLRKIKNKNKYNGFFSA